MSLATTANRVVHNGNASATVFPYTFPIPDASYLSVVYTDASGVETTLASNLYSVTGIGSTAGGSVTYPLSGSAIATGTKLTIIRTVPYTQPTKLTTQGGYYPEVTESALDRITMAIQQVYDRAARAFSAPVSDGTNPADMPSSTQRANSGAGSFLAFDGSGNPYAAALTALSGVSTWIQNNLLPQTSAAAARSTLSVPSIANLRSYLAGLGTSNNGGAPNTTIDVAAGVCMDDTNAYMLTYAGGTIDFSTTGANGLDTGAIASNTTYHLFVIAKTDGTTAVLASTSLASPTYPSGYTLKRRIASIRTKSGAAQIQPYVQDGDLFQWTTIVLSQSATNPGTSAVSVALTVPTGVRVIGRLLFNLVNLDTSNTSYAYLSDLSTTDTSPSAASGIMDTPNTASASANVAQSSARFDIPTNTSAQIRIRLAFSNANVGYYIYTLGWVDRRGRDS